MRLVNEGNLPLAVHLCGCYAVDVLCGRFDFTRRLCGVRRIQLNINSANALVADPSGACVAFTTFPSIEWIIQYNDDTAPLWTRVLEMGPFTNVSVLHDRSCGKGEYTGDFSLRCRLTALVSGTPMGWDPKWSSTRARRWTSVGSRSGSTWRGLRFVPTTNLTCQNAGGAWMRWGFESLRSLRLTIEPRR